MSSIFSKIFGNKNNNTTKLDNSKDTRQSFSGYDKYDQLNRFGPRPTQYFEHDTEYYTKSKPSKPMDLSRADQISSLLPVAPQSQFKVTQEQKQRYNDEKEIEKLVENLVTVEERILRMDKRNSIVYGTALRNRSVYITRLYNLNLQYEKKYGQPNILGTKAYNTVLGLSNSGGKRKTHRKHKTHKTMRSKSHKTNKIRTTRRR